MHNDNIYSVVPGVTRRILAQGFVLDCKFLIESCCASSPLYTPSISARLFETPCICYQYMRDFTRYSNLDYIYLHKLICLYLYIYSRCNMIFMSKDKVYVTIVKVLVNWKFFYKVLRYVWRQYILFKFDFRSNTTIFIGSKI